MRPSRNWKLSNRERAELGGAVLASWARAALARIGFAALLLTGMVLPSCLQCHAQEYPYFVTYSQEMEEPGNLDIEWFNAVGNSEIGNRFMGSDIEFEYGLKGCRWEDC